MLWMIQVCDWATEILPRLGEGPEALAFAEEAFLHAERLALSDPLRAEFVERACASAIEASWLAATLGLPATSEHGVDRLNALANAFDQIGAADAARRAREAAAKLSIALK